MADISTATSMARVPILGEDGRISDDYIPKSIPQAVDDATKAAQEAVGAASAADGSAKQAAGSATAAQGSSKAASSSAAQAAGSATAAQGSAKAAADSATAAQGSAEAASGSAQQAADKAASVLDHYIESATATTLEPGSEATASVADKVLTLGIPRGDKGDKGDKGDPGDISAVQVAEGSDLSVSTDGGTVTIDDSALRERIAELENQAANVLKGTLGPDQLLSADDAYATTPRRLTVYGETRQNLWSNPATSTVSGITLTSNADGSVTLSGTASRDSVFIVARSYILRPSTSYTLSIDKAFSQDIRIGCRINKSFVGFSLVAGQTRMTFTTPATLTTVDMGVVALTAGTTVSGTYRVMLNEGSEPQPWYPPGLNSVDELSLVTSGKNLINTNGASVLQGNFGVALPNLTLQPGSYVVKCPSGLTGILAIYRNGDTSSSISSITESGRSFTITSPVHGLDFRSSEANQITLDNISQFQLELGSTATEYEPPNITTTTIDLDGNSLRSLPDGTCDELTIDATGAVTLTKRVGSVTLSSNAGDWEEDAAGSRYSMRISPEALNPYTPGSVISDALPYRGWSDHAYTGTHVIAVGGATYVSVGTDETAQDIVAVCGGKKLLYTLATPETITLPPVTLPTLPAPTVNVFADAESSGTGYAMGPDMGMEYERDVTVAFDKLQAQVSALNILEATND